MKDTESPAIGYWSGEIPEISKTIPTIAIAVINYYNGMVRLYCRKHYKTKHQAATYVVINLELSGKPP